MFRPGLIEYMLNVTIFLNRIVIPALLALAFFFVVFNIVRYFIFKGDTEDGQKAAKSQIIYSVSAFVVVFIFWGMVELLTATIGLEDEPVPCPDYLMTLPGNPCSRYRPAATPRVAPAATPAPQPFPLPPNELN